MTSKDKDVRYLPVGYCYHCMFLNGSCCELLEDDNNVYKAIENSTIDPRCRLPKDCKEAKRRLSEFS